MLGCGGASVAACDVVHEFSHFYSSEVEILVSLYNKVGALTLHLIGDLHSTPLCSYLTQLPDAAMTCAQF
jgi:hypothetical protein